jgi:adenine deaminase
LWSPRVDDSIRAISLVSYSMICRGSRSWSLDAPCVRAGDGSATPIGQRAADLVFHGGLIYTVDSTHPWVQAVAGREGRIVHVGDSSAFGSATARDRPHRQGIAPGFHDSHVHP